MKRYLVGGAVRDALLGLPVVDRDWVLVGADVDAAGRGRLSGGRRATSRCSFIPRRTRSTRSRAPSARPAPGYRGFAFHAGPERHARRGPAAPRPDDQRDGAGRRRRADRPVRRQVRSREQGLPPCLAGLRRRPGAHPSPGPLRRAPSGLPRRPRDRGPDAADGRGRRSRCPGAGARLARGLARPDGRRSPRGCSRCFAPAARSSGCCPRWRACSACRSAPTTTRRSTPACT